MTLLDTAIQDIEASIREAQFITDPRDVGVQANIRQRLKTAAAILRHLRDKQEPTT